MDFEITSHLSNNRLAQWRELIESSGLVADVCAERTVLVFDKDRLVATGGRDGCVLKLIAVAESHRGEDLTAGVITALRRDAFADGHTHLFLYTKPENRFTFESLFFYPVVESERVLVMENKPNGLSSFLEALPKAPTGGEIGAIVMNCNPFTLGHRYLIERAAEECSQVFIFVLSEEKSTFSSADRKKMVELGTAHLPNVTVLETGPYLISSATFPSYFIKDRSRARGAACEVDVEIFIRHFAPRLAITRRYVGTEPLSPLTAEYNTALMEKLPQAGIEVCEIERISTDSTPISASTVRKLIDQGNVEMLSRFLPNTTLDYLRKKNYI